MNETNDKKNVGKSTGTSGRYRKTPAKKTAEAKTTVETKRASEKPAAQRTVQKRTGTAAAAKTRSYTPRKNTGARNKKPLKIIPLGGLGEIGKNITLYEYDGDMFLVDCGMSFPDEETPGIDIVIPDFTYVLENKDKIKGMVVTHGHEDHIGAIPYLLRNFNVPIYATRPTTGLIEGKLKEHRLLSSAKLNFKIDTTPIDDFVIDIGRFSELGKQGVLALMSDSTNAARPGYTPSERIVGESFSKLFGQAGDSRIIVATFSSNIHRIQQIIDEAVRCGRKVAVSGRSMINVVNVAANLGYLNVPDNVLVDIEMIRNYPANEMVIVTTGSQGEPMSALHRIAFSEHRQVEIIPGDMIIISANPIPGNEKLVNKVINELMKRGANVVYERMYDVHVSGHACQEELKLMMSIIKPKYFIPLHGEQMHLVKHAGLARQMGIPEDNILIASNGSVIEVTDKSIKSTETVQAGRVLVDGLGVGDVGSIVLRDRKHLADDGIIIIAVSIDSVTHAIISGPDVVSRGFVYVKESERMMNDISHLVCDTVDYSMSAGIHDWASVKTKIKERVSRYVTTKTRRAPMILPIIMEV